MTDSATRRTSLSERARHIKSLINLSSIAQQYGLAPQKAGREYKALCPFHEDRNPSLSLNDAKGVFLCRSCQSTGDHLDLAGQLLGVDLSGAAERIMSDFAITDFAWEQQTPHSRKPPETSAEFGFEVLDKAWAYFRHQLASGEDETAQYARAYVRSRELPLTAVGLAPQRYRFYEAGIDVSAEALVALGLLRQRQDATHQPFFRHRLIFPLRNEAGRIVGFAGRRLGEQGPKYLNSPETYWFHKSRVLYHPARDAATQAPDAGDQADEEAPIYVVEGYTDALRLAMAGVDARAVMGLAVSSGHARMLCATERPIVLVYDGDSAGQKALWRSLMALLGQVHRNEKISIVALSGDTDPDEYVREHGFQAFEALPRQLWHHWLVEQCVSAMDQSQGPVGRNLALTRFSGDIHDAIAPQSPQLAEVITDWLHRQANHYGQDGDDAVCEGVRQWLVRFLRHPQLLRRAIEHATPPTAVPGEPVTGLRLLLNLALSGQRIEHSRWERIESGWDLIQAVSEVGQGEGSTLARAWVGATGDPVSILTHPQSVEANPGENHWIEQWQQLMQFLGAYTRQAPLWAESVTPSPH